MAGISFNELVALIIKETVRELKRRGIPFSEDVLSSVSSEAPNGCDTKLRVDFSGYRTPLLTEERALSFDSCIKEIEIPKNTVLTTSAYEVIKKRKIKIIKYEKE